MTKLTDKQFNKQLENIKLTRSTLKRWKRAFYLKERIDTPLTYMKRLLDFKLP